MATKKSNPAVKRIYAKKGYRFRKKYGAKVEDLIIPSMVYGGLRAKISNALQPILAKFPIAGVGDELVLGTAHYFGAKKVKNKFAKDFFRSGLVVEGSRIGEAIADGSIMKGSLNQQAKGSGYPV